jgi:hypothetical protein
VSLLVGNDSLRVHDHGRARGCQMMSRHCHTFVNCDRGSASKDKIQIKCRGLSGKVWRLDSFLAKVLNYKCQKKSAQNEKKRVDTNRIATWSTVNLFVFFFTLVNQIWLVLAVRYSVFFSFSNCCLCLVLPFSPKIKSFSWSNCSKYIFFVCVYFSVRNSWWYNSFLLIIQFWC